MNYIGQIEKILFDFYSSFKLFQNKKAITKYRDSLTFFKKKMNGIEPQGKPWTQEATHKTHPGASPGEFLR